MLRVQELKELIRALDQSSIDEFNYEQNGMKVTLKKNKSVVVQEIEKNVVPEVVASKQAAPVKVEQVEVQAVPQTTVQVEKKEEQTSAQAAENVHTITSPMVGTFYAAPSPDSPPYVNKGDDVKESTVVCIVEAMKLMNEIEAEVNGKIVDVLVENGQLVEYGQPLFVVELS